MPLFRRCALSTPTDTDELTSPLSPQDRDDLAVLVDAHAGDDELWETVAILQRFDLSGRARLAIPMVVDLQRRTMPWTDVNLTSQGAGDRQPRQTGRVARVLRGVSECRVTSLG